MTAERLLFTPKNADSSKKNAGGESPTHSDWFSPPSAAGGQPAAPRSASTLEERFGARLGSMRRASVQAMLSPEYGVKESNPWIANSDSDDEDMRIAAALGQTPMEQRDRLSVERRRSSSLERSLLVSTAHAVSLLEDNDARKLMPRSRSVSGKSPTPKRRSERDKPPPFIRIADALHNQWRSARTTMPDGSFEPRIKTIRVGSGEATFEVDIANTPFEGLPFEYQRANLVAGRYASRFIEQSHRTGMDVESQTWMEAASANTHECWIRENPWCEDPDLLCVYEKLTEEEKEKDRDVVRIALREYTAYVYSLFKRARMENQSGGRPYFDDTEPSKHTFPCFAIACATASHNMRERGVISDDADIMELNPVQLLEQMRADAHSGPRKFTAPSASSSQARRVMEDAEIRRTKEVAELQAMRAVYAEKVRLSNEEMMNDAGDEFERSLRGYVSPIVSPIASPKGSPQRRGSFEQSDCEGKIVSALKNPAPMKSKRPTLASSGISSSKTLAERWQAAGSKEPIGTPPPSDNSGMPSELPPRPASPLWRRARSAMRHHSKSLKPAARNARGRTNSEAHEWELTKKRAVLAGFASTSEHDDPHDDEDTAELAAVAELNEAVERAQNIAKLMREAKGIKGPLGGTARRGSAMEEYTSPAAPASQRRRTSVQRSRRNSLDSVASVSKAAIAAIGSNQSPRDKAAALREVVASAKAALAALSENNDLNDDEADALIAGVTSKMAGVIRRGGSIKPTKSYRNSSTAPKPKAKQNVMPTPKPTQTPERVLLRRATEYDQEKMKNLRDDFANEQLERANTGAC